MCLVNFWVPFFRAKILVSFNELGYSLNDFIFFSYSGGLNREGLWIFFTLGILSCLLVLSFIVRTCIAIQPKKEKKTEAGKKEKKETRLSSAYESFLTFAISLYVQSAASLSWNNLPKCRLTLIKVTALDTLQWESFRLYLQVSWRITKNTKAETPRKIYLWRCLVISTYPASLENQYEK